LKNELSSNQALWIARQAIAQVPSWDDNEESDLRFEWDDQKAVENFSKHGVRFGEATEVFHDPNALEGKDAEHSFDEARSLLLDIQPAVCYSPCSPNGTAR
jgi:hypothetical protein